MRQYFVEEMSDYDDAKAFKLAIDAGLLKTNGYLTNLTSGNTILSSTEYGNLAQQFVCVNSNGVSSSTTSGNSVVYSGICAGNNKYDGARIRPICRF